MSYHISSDRFDNPYLSELLKILAARDMVLGGIYNRKTGRWGTN